MVTASVPQTRDIFDWLLGEWSLVREVSGLATIRGHAHFVAVNANTTAYEERAVVEMRDGQTLQGAQQYTFVRSRDGFTVYFAAGDKASKVQRLFHAVAFSPGEDGCLRGGAEHGCKADMYTSSYAILTDGTFMIRHIVRGPRKDYSIDTLYRRKV